MPESTVVADGQQSLVGIRLVPRAFPLPARLSDANGLRWELSPGGRLAVAGCALFDMQVDGQSFPGMEEGFPVTDGVEVGTESRRDGLHFGRRVYVSARDGFFARIVDSLRNEGPERRRVAPRWLQDRDAENIGGDRSFLSASHGCVGLLSPGLELGPRSVQAPELWLEPGATARWIQFAVFRPQPPDVGEALALLSGFPEVALVALSRREEISNLGPSTTSSPLLATSGVELQAVLPEGPVLPAGRLQLRVHSALFDREITAILDPTGGARILPLPVGQLQVVVEHPATGARGRAEATLEPDRLCRLTVVLGDCGTVEGTVVDGQGLPVPGCDVFVQGTRTATTLGGGFRQRGIPLGRKTVEVQERQTGLRARTEVELTEVGQTVRTSLALPPVGSLSGRVLDAEGAPVPEALISLRVIDPLNGESRSLRADVSGRYDIATVRAGPAQVIATHPRTGAVGLVEVEVLPFAQVQCDLSLGVVGVVTVRALDGQGLPVPGARVRVQDGPLQRDGIADGAGRFTVVGVDAGSLSVEARGPDGVGLGITTARL
ncbi:MAG TPA: carboxypeptidase-like regulatory domain-containing protein, partial [Myxococcota bacterium]|nr:carboxypeptidase-like regulatory domain-containing protein [Myxococcota bacterium]